VKINPNGKQVVVYRVTTLLFPGKQPIACLKRVTTLSKKFQNFEKIKNVHKISKLKKENSMFQNLKKNFKNFSFHNISKF
jgi:hypothetical protein